MIDALYDMKANLEFCVGMLNGLLTNSRDSDLKECFFALSTRVNEMSYKIDDLVIWTRDLPVNIELKYKTKN